MSLLNRLLPFYTLLIFFSVQSLHAQENVILKLHNEIDKLIKYETNINYETTPGFIVSVIDRDTVFYLSFGSHVGSHNIINKHDVFEVGSVTKPIVADAIISKYSSDFFELRLNDLLAVHYNSLSGITLMDLLCHKTRFPKSPNQNKHEENTVNHANENYSLDDLRQYLTNTPNTMASEICAYSHINYAILELIFENSNIDPEEFISSYLSKKGMVNSSVSNDIQSSPGIDKFGKSASSWVFKSFKTSEGLKSNSVDLSIFVRSMFDNPNWKKYEHNRCSTIFNDKFHTTIGWTILEDTAKFDIYAMTGTTSKHNCFIAFIKETETAVIILANSSLGTDDLGLSILRMINDNWKRKS